MHQFDQANVWRVAIHGSCVTRDNFNSLLNPDYKKHFSVAILQNRSSIVSSVAAPLECVSTMTRWKGEWAKKTLLDDALKVFMRTLDKHEFDVAIVDNFSDVRFGYSDLLGTRVTRNTWHLPGTEYNEVFKAGQYKDCVPTSDWPAYQRQYRSSVHALIARIRECNPGARIVLNAARAATLAKNSAGTISRKFNVEKVNKAWTLLDQEFLSAVPEAAVIAVPQNLIVGWDGHPWGIGDVHYQKSFYNEFLKRLLAELGPKGPS